MANELDSLFFFGRPFGPLYGLIMKVREQLYTKNVFKQENPGVPVVSVGNLVLGGTGKTPTVIHLAKMLKTFGLKPAIISRGFGGQSKKSVNVVSDGESILMNAVSAGDEPVLIARSLPDIPVVTGKKRILPCKYAVTQFGVNIIILDDGFQHMGVTRDINLVLFDASTLAGNSRIFPAGPLREPISALKRTTAFLISGQHKGNKNRSESFADLLRSKFENIPVFIANYSHPTLVDANDKPVSAHKVKDAYVFCAIANPDRVSNTLENINVNIVGSTPYKDHTPYNQRQITALCEQASLVNAQYLITTTKDFVKVKGFHFSLPLLVLQVNQRPESGFDEYILKKIPHNR